MSLYGVWKTTLKSNKLIEYFSIDLRWLKTVSSAYVWMGRYNHSLFLDATIQVSKHYPIIGEHVGIIFVTL